MRVNVTCDPRVWWNLDRAILRCRARDAHATADVLHELRYGRDMVYAALAGEGLPEDVYEEIRAVIAMLPAVIFPDAAPEPFGAWESDRHRA